MMNQVSRRKFLQGGAMSAAAVGVMGAAGVAQGPTENLPSETGKPLPVKLGLASYTFRSFTRAQMIAFMKTLHVTDLNCKDIKDHLPQGKTADDFAGEDAAIAEYAANGIKLHAAGTLYFPKDEDDDIRAKFEYCKRAGIRTIVAGDPEAKTLPRIEKFVKEYDIQFAIHNHGPEDKIWHSPLDVLKVVKGMDPRMGCCIDIGHCMRAGTDVVKAIHEVGPRLFNMHAKDLTDYSTKDSQVAVGEGRMPIREIFEALVAIKYPGFVDLEYEIHGDDPMPGVIASFSYMRGVLTGLGYHGNLL